MRQLPNPPQVVGKNVIKTFAYGFSPSVSLPVKSEIVKSGELRLGIIYLFSLEEVWYIL